MTWGDHWSGDWGGAEDTYSLDVQALMRRRLFTVLRKKAGIQNLVDWMASQLQEASEVTQLTRRFRNIVNGVGDTLDRHGYGLRMPRQGLDDETYRKVLVIRFASLFRERTVELAMDLLEALSLGTDATAQFDDLPPMAYRNVLSNIAGAVASRWHSILKTAKPEGILMHTQVIEDPDVAFRYDLNRTVEVVGRDFDGVDDHIQWANLADLGSGNPFTVALWVRLATSTSGRRFVTLYNSGGARVVELGQNSLRPFLIVSRDTSPLVRTASTFIDVGVWTHIVISYDGSGLASGATMSVQGVAEASYAATIDGAGAARAADGVTVLGNLSPSTGNDGGQTQPRVWDHVLTPAEVWAEYRSPAAPAKTSGLLWAPPMDTLEDPISGLTGTATGTTVVGDIELLQATETGYDNGLYSYTLE